MSSTSTDLETVDLSITNTNAEIPSKSPYIDPVPLKLPTSTAVEITPYKHFFGGTKPLCLFLMK